MPHPKFGELRSLLMDPWSDATWGSNVWSLIEDVRREDPHTWTDEWLPYLSGHDVWRDGALAHADTLVELRQFVAIAPFASFGFQPNVRDLVAALADGSLTRALVYLDARHLSLGEHTSTLMECDALPNLRELLLSGVNLFDEGAIALSRSAFAGQLRLLDVSSNGVGLEGARALAEALAHAPLRTLDVRNNRMGAAGVEALLRGADVSGLEHLGAGEVHGGDDLARAIARASEVTRITTLSLSSNGIGAEGAKALFASPHLARLESLTMTANTIAPEGAFALANSPHASNLRQLNLDLNRIGDAGARALFDSPFMSNIKDLNLRWNTLDASTVEALAGSEMASRLERLVLSANAIGDAGVRELSGALGALTHLRLDGCGIGEEGAQALADLDAWPALEVLSVRDNALGGSAHALKEAWSGRAYVGV